uniref:NAM-associated domain-containing protein n=1 Tax=Strongyloides venezuelensis TaxID=75913 RepID=A0A0K0FSD9_STRVS
MKDSRLAELVNETTIILNSNILIKDLCKSIMDRYDLGHVADNFQVYVRHLDSEYYPWKTYFGDNNGQISNPTIQVTKNEFEGHSSRGLPFDSLLNMDEIARARHWNNTSTSRRILQVPEMGLTRNLASGPQQNRTSHDHLGSNAFKDHVEALDSIIRGLSNKTPSHN